MTPYRDITPRDSGLYETCARHTERHTARLLQTGYFCDDCTRRVVVEAFNNRPPVFHGETVQGYCALCNQMGSVTLRQWFVCGPCWNVILAYQKSIAASEAIKNWWTKTIAPLFPSLLLEETEPMHLAPYARSAQTKRQMAASLSTLDFVVGDSSATPNTPLFHIEQKTGPGSIDAMQKFQLDVNDFNDIAGAVNSTRIPAYVIHVQANGEYAFPTRGTVINGMWWTDVFTLRNNQQRVAPRRGEDKYAINYNPTAFKSVDTFVDELKAERYELLRMKLTHAPIDLIDSRSG